MKTLKLVIFALLFVAGQQAFSQNINVNNSFPIDMDVKFIFDVPCPAVTTSTPGNTMSSTPFTPGCNLLSIEITFIDDSCNPPQKVTIPVTITSLPINFNYTLCAGNVVSFSLNPVGADYNFDIF
jgi:hypothetical protein